MPKGKHDDPTDELPTQIVRGRVGPDPSKIPFRVSLVEPNSEIVGADDSDAPTVPLSPEPRRGAPRHVEPDDHETAVAPRPAPRPAARHADPEEQETAVAPRPGPARPRIAEEPPPRPRADVSDTAPKRQRPPEEHPRHEPMADTGPMKKPGRADAMDDGGHGAMMKDADHEPGGAMMKPGEAMHDAGGMMAKADAMMMAKMAEPAAPSEPVVGWLVVIDGPGRGRFVTIHKGLSTLGRAPSQRLRIDFGDTRIESERHAILIYDEKQRRFVINHDGKTELVRVNGDILIAPRDLVDRDLVTIGATTMAFVAFCGASFDWDGGPASAT